MHQKYCLIVCIRLDMSSNDTAKGSSIRQSFPSLVKFSGICQITKWYLGNRVGLSKTLSSIRSIFGLSTYLDRQVGKQPSRYVTIANVGLSKRVENKFALDDLDAFPAAKMFTRPSTNRTSSFSTQWNRAFQNKCFHSNNDLFYQYLTSSDCR